MNNPVTSIRLWSKFAATGACLLLASCISLIGDTRSLPLAEGQQVTRVSIVAYVRGKPPVKKTITQAKDVAFVVHHLKDLPFRTYSHSNPEINLTLHVSDGGAIERRVGADGIGPGVPASGYQLHWFPKDDSLYRFLVAKAYPGSAR
jgi:hypothetical protein